MEHARRFSLPLKTSRAERSYNPGHDLPVRVTGGRTPMSRLCVIAISGAFKAFWNDLAVDLDVQLDVIGAADSLAHPDTVALIVAAGGAEREAIQWLESRPVPKGMPVLVVGTDPGRRTAMQLVARGASDYFSLPDDLEIFRNATIAALKSAGARAEQAVDQLDAFAGIVGESPNFKKD